MLKRKNITALQWQNYVWHQSFKDHTSVFKYFSLLCIAPYNQTFYKVHCVTFFMCCFESHWVPFVSLQKLACHDFASVFKLKKHGSWSWKHVQIAPHLSSEITLSKSEKYTMQLHNHALFNANSFWLKPLFLRLVKYINLRSLASFFWHFQPYLTVFISSLHENSIHWWRPVESSGKS